MNNKINETEKFFDRVERYNQNRYQDMQILLKGLEIGLIERLVFAGLEYNPQISLNNIKDPYDRVFFAFKIPGNIDCSNKFILTKIEESAKRVLERLRKKFPEILTMEFNIDCLEYFPDINDFTTTLIRGRICYLGRTVDDIIEKTLQDGVKNGYLTQEGDRFKFTESGERHARAIIERERRKNAVESFGEKQ